MFVYTVDSEAGSSVMLSVRLEDVCLRVSCNP